MSNLPAKLRASHLLVAYMEAGGKNGVQIAAALGKSAVWVYQVQKGVGYKRILAIAQEEIQAAMVANTADLARKFDDEAERSFDTIVEVRDGANELGSTRLKASLEILDRAPSAPKKRTEHFSENVTTLQIPIQQVGYIREALVDTGDSEIVEALDYTIEEREVAVDEKEGYKVTELGEDGDG